MEKRWLVKPTAPVEFLNQHQELPGLLAQLLYNRGITNQEDLDNFLNPDYGRLYDPYLFCDMEKAVARIASAIKNRELIMIHGDYDADGVSGAAVLYRALRALGAQAEVFIPHREDDGYGLNIRNVPRFKADGVKLLLTTDCGTSNVAETAALTAAGIDVIITDHHQVPEVLPEVCALMNPHAPGNGYPFLGLTGAGVAFKLVQALFSNTDLLASRGAYLEQYGGAEGFKKWLLDIVAIGTVADIGPLVGENRILVKWGLVVLGQTRHVGLERLLKIIGAKTIDAHTIGYQIAPRINAAGRLEHARHAYDLLVEDEGERAEKMAWEIHQYNLRRQKITEQMIGEAEKQTPGANDKILFFYNRDWEPGVVGLVAGKLADRFYRPVLAMTEINGKIVGSGRSVPGFNITDCLKSASAHLDRFGGHEQACGFTIKSLTELDPFKQSLLAASEQTLTPEKLLPMMEVDAEIKFSDLTEPLIMAMEKFAPFGEGNGKPNFLLKNLLVAAVDKIGNGEKHLRLLARQDTPKVFKLIWFYPQLEWFNKLHPGAIIDVVAEVGINDWNGRREIEVKIIDLKLVNPA